MKRDVNVSAVFQAPSLSGLFVIVMLVLYGVYMQITEHAPSAPELAMLGTVVVWMFVTQARAWIAVTDTLDAFEEVLDAARDRVDPWEMQRELMKASDQTLPYAPRMHNGVLLYAALQLEELAEELNVMSAAAASHPGSPPAGLNAISVAFYQVSRRMRDVSLEVRNTIPTFDCDYPLSREHAVGLLDGTTDLAVVNAGFALSAGLPGAEGYLEVASSNYSKTNRTTGKIDKTPDGKWIKGQNYFPPNLITVLANQSPAWAAKTTEAHHSV